MNTAKKAKEKSGDEIIVESHLKKVNKVKTPKVKLIRYTVKAIIPTGTYANIQPEVVVEAETLEQAERAVMPHIEAMFAKYREGNQSLIVYPPKSVVPATNVSNETIKNGDLVKIVDKLNENKVTPEQIMTTQTVESTSVPTAIDMSEPFRRAKSAIENAVSVEATQLIEDQIQKSVKLINDEKQELFTMVLLKRKEINENKTV